MRGIQACYNGELCFSLSAYACRKELRYSKHFRSPALKVQLRELYKRIHPDRFHGFPPARDTNERSFKLLQEYLAAGTCAYKPYTGLYRNARIHAFTSGTVAAARQSDQDKAALPYRFIFYLHQAGAQQPAAATSATEASEGTPDGLHKVSLTLPPPARRDFAQPDQLPAATQASISKLLSACGLQRYTVIQSKSMPVSAHAADCCT